MALKHLPCFAHTINLLVQEILKMDILQPVLAKCKSIVAFIKLSSTTMAKFKVAQNSTDPLCLVQEVPTRWNSAYQMLERILATKDALTIALLGTAKAPLPFGSEELEILEELCTLLRPFDKATKKISGAKYPTISLIIPMICEIQMQISNLKNTFKTPEVILAFDAIDGRFTERFAHYETRTVPRIATIIHPRFKKHGFSARSNAEQACRAMEEELISAIRKSSAPEKPAPPNPAESSAFFQNKAKLHSKTGTARSEAIVMLRQHMETANEPEVCEPLQYWNESSNSMAAFKEVVKKIMCVPATSCESERVFSKAGQIISDRRTSLKPDIVDKLMFINKNHQYLNKQ